MFTLFLQLLSIVGSGLAAMFVLGVCTKRANGIGVVVGAVSSGTLMLLIQQEVFDVGVHYFAHAVIGFTTCLVVGYTVSLVVGRSPDTRGPNSSA